MSASAALDVDDLYGVFVGDRSDAVSERVVHDRLRARRSVWSAKADRARASPVAPILGLMPRGAPVVSGRIAFEGAGSSASTSGDAARCAARASR